MAEYPRGAGAGRNGKTFTTLAQYFAIGKAHRGGNRYRRGREPGVQGAGGGKFRLPVPPLPQQKWTIFPQFISFHSVTFVISNCYYK